MVESIKELRKICQKPICEYNLFREGIWRIPSIYITKILLYTPIAPDHVTFFMVFLGFVATYFFSTGDYWYFITGALLLEFVYIIDGVDGEIARYRKTSSLRGVFLDLISHISNTALPFLGMTLGLYRSNPSFEIVVLGLFASVFSVCTLDVQLLKHHVVFKELIKLAKQEKKSTQIKKIIATKQNIEGGIFKIIFKKLINPFYDIFLITQIIMLAAVFNKIYWVLIFYGLTFPVIWLIKVIYEYKIGTKDYDFLLKPYKK